MQGAELNAQCRRNVAGKLRGAGAKICGAETSRGLRNKEPIKPLATPAQLLITLPQLGTVQQQGGKTPWAMMVITAWEYPASLRWWGLISADVKPTRCAAKLECQFALEVPALGGTNGLMLPLRRKKASHRLGQAVSPVNFNLRQVLVTMVTEVADAGRWPVVAWQNAAVTSMWAWSNCKVDETSTIQTGGI